MYIIGQNNIIRLSDRASIPLDPENTAYQIYLQWCAEGNVADPADPDQMDNARAIRTMQMRMKRNDTWWGGFSSSALGTPHMYASADVDQVNFQNAMTANQPAPLLCIDGDDRVMVPHTVAQIKTVNDDWMPFRDAAQQKFDDRVVEINAAPTVVSIYAINWD